MSDEEEKELSKKDNFQACVGLIIILAVGGLVIWGIGGAVCESFMHGYNSATAEDTPTAIPVPKTVKSAFESAAEDSYLNYKEIIWNDDEKQMLVGIESGGWDVESATTGANWDIIEVMKILDSDPFLRNNVNEVGIVFSVDVTDRMTGEESIVFDGLIAEFYVDELDKIANFNNVLPDESFMNYYCYRYENNLWKYYPD